MICLFGPWQMMKCHQKDKVPSGHSSTKTLAYLKYVFLCGWIKGKVLDVVIYNTSYRTLKNKRSDLSHNSRTWNASVLSEEQNQLESWIPKPKEASTMRLYQTGETICLLKNEGYNHHQMNPFPDVLMETINVRPVKGRRSAALCAFRATDDTGSGFIEKFALILLKQVMQ